MPWQGPATALLALWNDVDPALEAAYNDWHAREHVPERLTVPGIEWALRYGHAGGLPLPRYLTLYGLRDLQVLDSAPYQALLAHPTPASRAMRPRLRNLSRWICSIDRLEAIDRFGCLSVRTLRQDAAVTHDPAPMAGGVGIASGARLIATRILGAPGLPWLTEGASRPVEGDRIEAWAHDVPSMPAPGADGALYERLPVG